MDESKPLISVVIPIYNVEDYLERCLATVRQQTYPRIEILLIDDGSTDASGKICDRMANEDERIRVIHQDHQDVAEARNIGAREAIGEYITFVDSDDMAAPDLVEYLYSLLDRYRTPMALCSHTVVFLNGRKIEFGNGKEECLTAEECIRRMLYRMDVDTSVWAKLYKREILTDIIFPKGKLFEDIAATYKAFVASSRIACGFRSKYSYCVRRNSIVRMDFSPRKLDLLEMTDRMGEEVVKAFPALEAAVMCRRVYARFSTLNQMAKVQGFVEEKKQIIQFIRTHRSGILHDPMVPLRDKMAILCLAVGERFYHFAWWFVSPC